MTCCLRIEYVIHMHTYCHKLIPWTYVQIFPQINVQVTWHIVCVYNILFVCIWISADLWWWPSTFHVSPFLLRLLLDELMCFLHKVSIVWPLLISCWQVFMGLDLNLSKSCSVGLQETMCFSWQMHVQKPSSSSSSSSCHCNSDNADY